MPRAEARGSLLFVISHNNRNELLSEILKMGGNWIDPRSNPV